MVVLITGATGLVGSRLVDRCDQVIVTSRNPESARQKFGDRIVDAISWNPVSQSLSLHDQAPIHAVVNLMGESIAEGRWTPAKKQRIRDSRVVGTQRLVAAIGNMDIKPQVVVSASAVGIYGDHAEQEITEHCQPGEGFLAEVCQAWEAAAHPLIAMGVRLVTIRTGIVMSPAGGALTSMLPIFKSGLGGRLGDGRQFFPWIHLEDLVSLIVWAINNDCVKGVYNASAPTPVTNREFTTTLATILNRPAMLPVPRLALRLALGEFADSLFASQRVIPKAAMLDGFKFQFENLQDCLIDLLHRNQTDA